MSNVLLDKKLVDNNIIFKVWKKVDSLAEARGMTREEFIEWSEEEHNKSNISGYEINLISAYQANKVIERLKINNKTILAGDMETEYSWINIFKANFNKVEEALKHLKEVCEYVETKEGREYDYKWLFDYDDILFDKIINKNEGKYKKNKLIRKD